MHNHETVVQANATYVRKIKCVWKGYLLTEPIDHLVHPFNHPVPLSDAYLLGHGLRTTDDVGRGVDGEGGRRRHHRLGRSEGHPRRRGLVQRRWTPTRHLRRLRRCVCTPHCAALPRRKARSPPVGEVALPLVGDVPLPLDEGLQVKTMTVGVDHLLRCCRYRQFVR